ncbi:MAG: tRNA lysidine(34) synthetase TilS [Firmicutes bacterium]|nr:tRNA lysidine(34) synthetase TilS [Bacillota bacterium]
MKDKVLATIAEHRMLSPGDTVIVAVSGGADSMCLLSLLSGLQNEMKIRVIAAHMNHLLRGAEADRDELFVTDWCRQHEIPLQVERKNIAGLARARRIGTEECGREERYAFFRRLSQQFSAAKIATAHTLSDQMETVLLHLTRGSGSRGLCGIPPVRGNIIRPLLNCTRAEIEEYCRQNAIPYVLDVTNGDPSYARNRIRLQVIPELEKINPGFSEAVRRMTGQMTAQEEYLTARAEETLQNARQEYGYSVGMLSAVPAVIRLRCCRIAAEKNGVSDLEERHLKQLDRLLFHGGRCSLPGEITADVFRSQLRFISSGALRSESFRIPITPPQTCRVGRKKYSFETVDAKFFLENRKVYKKFVSAALNYDTISGSIVLRSRLPGDTFQPAGRGVTKTLKKMFNERGVPPEQRGQLAVMESDGMIFWVEGFGGSEQARLFPDTHKILLIIVEESE